MKQKKYIELTAGLKIIIRRWYFLIIFIVLICPLAISSSDDTVSLTVMNKTAYFLHVLMGDKSFLFIGPDKSAIYKTKGSASLHVQVFYSPGQGVSGYRTRDINISPYRAESTGCSNDQSSQSSNGGGCECSTNPASGGPRTWVITDDSLHVSP